MRILWIGLACLLAAGAADAGEVQLVARTAGGQSEFHIGELIRLELAYSCTANSANEYQITNAGYDRSGRSISH